MVNSVLTFTETFISYARIVAPRTGQLNVVTTCTIQLTGVVAGSGNTVVQELPFNPELLGDASNSTTFTAKLPLLSHLNVTMIMLCPVFYQAIGYNCIVCHIQRK